MIQKFQKAERIFNPTYKEKTNTIDLETFIMKNFQTPDNDLKRICEFIRQDLEFERIVYNLPDLIKKEIQYDKLHIKFYDEFQDEYLRLEVHIITSIDIAVSLEIEYELEQELYGLYEKNSADKLLLIME